MSSTIKQAILSLKSRIADAYTAIVAKGGTLPETQDSANLPSAIASIPSGGASTIDAGTGIIFYKRTYNSVQSTITERLKIVGGAGRQDWQCFFFNYGYGVPYAGFPDISEMDTSDGVTFWDFYGAIRLSTDSRGKILPTIHVTNKCTILEQFCYACQFIGIDTSSWDCSNVANINNFFLYAYYCFSIIGEHTLQEVESGDIIALRGLAINFSFGDASNMRYSSMLAAAKGVKDMTGGATRTMTFNATPWANQYNDDGSVPDAATIAARQSNIDAILTSKNWVRA